MRARSDSEPAAGPAAEPCRGGELVDQDVLFGAQSAGPFGVVPLLCPGELLVELGEAAPVGGPGLRVEDAVDSGFGHVVQIAALNRGAGHAGSGCELGQLQGDQLAAGVADQQVQVPQARAVRHPGEEIAVDGCITEALGGGQCAGRSPVDRGKQGMKRSSMTDGYGIPLDRVLSGASRHDSGGVVAGSSRILTRQVRAPLRARIMEVHFERPSADPEAAQPRL